ncbi:MAG: hypothetical protein WC043_10690 [Pseudobdellovibrionaceae bacterium]
MVTFTLIEEFSDRQRLVEAARVNLKYVYDNGGAKNYSLEKLGLLIKEAVPDHKWHKKEVSNFLDGKATLAQQDIAEILALFKLSVNLREKVEPLVQEGLEILDKTKIPSQKHGPR